MWILRVGYSIPHLSGIGIKRQKCYLSTVQKVKEGGVPTYLWKEWHKLILVR
jgi:hypothetical protein